AVRGSQQVLAVAGVAIQKSDPPDVFEKDLMVAILDECGLALEKEAMQRAKQQMEQTARQEALRANLLRAISHDLRTPLTSISGNAGVLMESGETFPPEKRQKLYGTIYDDALWLINLVENLLSITRIENGTIKLHRQPELLEEVFEEALEHLDRNAAAHHITTQVEEELLMAQMDARLIVQVVINIVNNAVKYTPAGSHICLSARRAGAFVAVSIADDGPGLPEAARAKLFEMFYTAEHTQGDSRRGLGLGLALCRAIIAAHGGEIWQENLAPHGARFCFTLPALEEPNNHE
ncbi:MAG: ATP-binding protein, partial [Gemmiger sp.]|nr:ATP-binding protein [Gemmiger sp.]